MGGGTPVSALQIIVPISFVSAQNAVLQCHVLLIQRDVFFGYFYDNFLLYEGALAIFLHVFF